MTFKGLKGDRGTLVHEPRKENAENGATLRFKKEIETIDPPKHPKGKDGSDGKSVPESRKEEAVIGASDNFYCLGSTRFAL